MQWKVIHSVLEERKDNCVIMATGKSDAFDFKAACINFMNLFQC